MVILTDQAGFTGAAVGAKDLQIAEQRQVVKVADGDRINAKRTQGGKFTDLGERVDRIKVDGQMAEPRHANRRASETRVVISISRRQPGREPIQLGRANAVVSKIQGQEIRREFKAGKISDVQ